jgi:hypothetical protein
MGFRYIEDVELSKCGVQLDVGGEREEHVKINLCYSSSECTLAIKGGIEVLFQFQPPYN